MATLIEIDPTSGGNSPHAYYTFTEPHITLDATKPEFDIWTIHTEDAHLWWMINAPPC